MTPIGATFCVPLHQWFPTGMPWHPKVPFTIPRGAVC